MARTPRTDRLATLEPAAVADRAVQAVADRVKLSEEGEAELRSRVAQMVRYAKGEARVADPSALIYEVCRAVFGVERDTDGVPHDSMPGLAALGARCRDRLERRPPNAVSTSELAALAGVHTSQIRRLLALGRLTRRPERGRVEPTSAREYLASLGVAGF